MGGVMGGRGVSAVSAVRVFINEVSWTVAELLYYIIVRPITY